MASALDFNCHGGGLMLSIKKDIPSNLLTMKEEPIDSFYIELNLRNKWLVIALIILLKTVYVPNLTD